MRYGTSSFILTVVYLFISSFGSLWGEEVDEQSSLIDWKLERDLRRLEEKQHITNLEHSLNHWALTSLRSFSASKNGHDLEATVGKLLHGASEWVLLYAINGNTKFSFSAVFVKNSGSCSYYLLRKSEIHQSASAACASSELEEIKFRVRNEVSTVALDGFSAISTIKGGNGGQNSFIISNFDPMTFEIGLENLDAKEFIAFLSEVWWDY